MAYTKQTWQDLPSKTTPINASRLGHIEQGIYDAASTADTAASNASSALSGLDDKVDKVTGKGLSTNDFTDALKTKLDNIETGAEVNVQSDWNQSDNSADDYIKNKPSLGTSAYKNSTSVVTDSSDLVESGAVFDVIGWGNKNLLENTHGTDTIRTVVFTENADGSVTVNGTADGNNALYSIGDIHLKANTTYILSGCPEGGGTTSYRLYIGSHSSDWTDTGNGCTFTVGNTDEDTYVAIYARYNVAISNKTFYPMIRLATITDDTYEPYHESVEQTLRDAEVVQGKNLLPITASSMTVNGVTFTVNEDGILYANGTTGSSSSSNYILFFDLPDGDYIFYTGYIPNNSATTFNIFKVSQGSVISGGEIAVINSASENNYVPFTVDHDGYDSLQFRIWNRSDRTFNYTCYPMICKAKEFNGTFEPYYISLKDVVPNKCDNSVIAPVENGNNASQAYAVGSHFIRNKAFCTVTSIISENESLVGSSKFTSGDVASVLKGFSFPTIVTNLSNVPLGFGVINLDGTISPIGSVLTVRYIRFGDSNNSVLIACRVLTGILYVNFQSDGTWLGWKTIDLSLIS